MEWMWSGQYADKMKVALFTDDWGTIAMLMPQTAERPFRDLHRSSAGS